MPQRDLYPNHAPASTTPPRLTRCILTLNLGQLQAVVEVWRTAKISRICAKALLVLFWQQSLRRIRDPCLGHPYDRISNWAITGTGTRAHKYSTRLIFYHFDARYEDTRAGGQDLRSPATGVVPRRTSQENAASRFMGLLSHHQLPTKEGPHRQLSTSPSSVAL